MVGRWGCAAWALALACALAALAGLPAVAARAGSMLLPIPMQAQRGLKQLNEVIKLKCTATHRRSGLWSDERCTDSCNANTRVEEILSGGENTECPGRECVCEMAPYGNPYAGVVKPGEQLCFSLRATDYSKHLVVAVNTSVHVAPRPRPEHSEGGEGEEAVGGEARGEEEGEGEGPWNPGALTVSLRSGTGPQGRRRTPNQHEHEIRFDVGPEPGAAGLVRLEREAWRRDFGARDEGEWVGPWTMCVALGGAAVPVGFDARVVFSECPAEPDGRECGGLDRGECGAVSVPCAAPLGDMMCKRDECVCLKGWEGGNCDVPAPAVEDTPSSTSSPTAAPTPLPTPASSPPPPPPPPPSPRPVAQLILPGWGGDPPLQQPTRPPVALILPGSPPVDLVLPGGGHSPVIELPGGDHKPVIEMPGDVSGRDDGVGGSGGGRGAVVKSGEEARGAGYPPWVYPLVGALAIGIALLAAVRLKGQRWLNELLRGNGWYSALPGDEGDGDGGGKAEGKKGGGGGGGGSDSFDALALSKGGEPVGQRAGRKGTQPF